MTLATFDAVRAPQEVVVAEKIIRKIRSGMMPPPGAKRPDEATLRGLAAALEAHIDRFVDHYNHCRYHESLQNLTPADVYFGRGSTILLERERIKRETIKHRRLQHQKNAA